MASLASSPQAIFGNILASLAPLVAQTVKNLLPAMQETWVCSLGQEDPLEKGMATPPVFFPGEFRGQRSLVGSVHGVAKSQTQLSE